MPAYNFQKRFAPAVRRGDKNQTIRAKRKNRPRVGQTAYCYTGMRTKKCRLIRMSLIRAVYDVVIYSCDSLRVDGDVFVGIFDLNLFAIADGFKNWSTMVYWFKKTHGLPFHGDLIQFEPFRNKKDKPW